MMAAKGAIKPVAELMKEAGEKFDPKSYLPAVAGYYSTAKGDMLSFPFNSLLDGDVVQQGRLQEGGPRPRRKPPKTWPEEFDAAKKLKAAGYANCGFANAWITWVNIEQFSRLAQCAARHQGQRHRRLRHRAEDQLAAAREASAESGRSAEGQDLRLFRPHQHRRGPLHLGRMPDHAHLLGVLRQCQGQREVRFRQCADALLSGRAGRAAELDHSAAPRSG